MSTTGKPLTEIAPSDLRDLIDNKVRESQTLEFKRENYGRLDDDIREMLRDISAMANAFGGDLLLGVDEDETGSLSICRGLITLTKWRTE
jgi:predicted HTH transcriptional regulator